MSDLRLRDVSERDAPLLAEIYNHYITETVATFETEPIDGAEFLERIESIVSGGFPFLVCESDDDGVIGYAYANRWKNRGAYASTVETTVYLDHRFTGRGAGTALMRRVVEIVEKSEFHAVIAGIALPNPASVALHERLGFEKVAHFRETGYKQDRWIDVGYWELVLDRRS